MAKAKKRVEGADFKKENPKGVSTIYPKPGEKGKGGNPGGGRGNASSPKPAREARPALALSEEELTRRLEEDPDFIASKRLDYSIAVAQQKYPNGCPNKVIARALLIEEDEVDELYQIAVDTLRKTMGVEDE